ncbi:major capsid protein [Microvirus mar43]|uniref:Major capsid protein n=1 Tax=Microvirus mar43 TaxID=2851178 RepID=A0A8F5MJ21_9VIRU|nr:major capsid protein [Microvirus mar43]
MSNPFKPSNSVVNKPKRNSFDLSRTNHLTFNFGQLIPVMCEEVLPGDTFKIDAALGLRFMPLAFPIQTKCRASVHFFYQRSKNLWSGFQNFIYGNDVISGSPDTPPFLDFSQNAQTANLKTCSLGDYLNIPTVRSNMFGLPGIKADFSAPFLSAGNNDELTAFNGARFPGWTTIDKMGEFLLGSDTYVPGTTSTDPTTGEDIYNDTYVYGLFPFEVQLIGNSPYLYDFIVDVPKSGFVLNVSSPHYVIYTSQTDGQPQFTGEASVEDAYMKEQDATVPCYRFRFTWDSSEANVTYPKAVVALAVPVLNYIDLSQHQPECRVYPTARVPMDAVDTGLGTPFQHDKLRVSSLPFRCYESIYNAFYRDDRNNPLTTADGHSVYNEYLLNTKGGRDDSTYVIHNRNWEFDPYTSAVRTPQQGVAPLVGISSLGNVTFNYDGQDYTFSTETADNADTITKVNVTENVPAPVARAIVNTVTSGISINDFRNVNSYQRWLETNIRRGLKYKDQTLARWGVQPADSTLDMPEFIGGFTVDVDINTVTNTNGDGSAPLGDYAANATAFGGSKHRISQYCDQHGYIMAIVSVVPAPVYTQLFPKKFSRFNALDYYSPEFSQIGMQAITYGEFCPLEVDNPSSSNPVEVGTVFGYQRPWYEYIYAPDEAHGLFRTDFNQFLLSRNFIDSPTLGPDFLTVSQGSLNDVFTVKNRNSILGMIRFNVEAQRPIPQISLPSL